MVRGALSLEHAMPGRARFRVPKPRTGAQVDAVAADIHRARSIKAVDANPQTGSLLVHYDPDDPVDDIVGELQRLGYLVQAAENLPGMDWIKKSEGSKIVELAFSRANSRLGQMTRGKADLRLVVPAIFAVLAARQFMRDAGRIRNASWYQLAYWAFDSFHKLHTPTDAD